MKFGKSKQTSLVKTKHFYMT